MPFVALTLGLGHWLAVRMPAARALVAPAMRASVHACALRGAGSRSSLGWMRGGAVGACGFPAQR